MNIGDISTETGVGTATLAGAFQKPEDSCEIFRKLHENLSTNCSTALASAQEQMRRVEIKARRLARIGELLAAASDSTSTQKEIATVFDEVFADCICSVYFAACGLDCPAQMVLRRGFELGVAAVYLWDLPHVYWGWKQHDRDLNFNEMLEHLTSAAYATYVSSAGGSGQWHFQDTTAHKLYRELSNAVHGKLATFETKLQDRFRYAEADWHNHLSKIERAQDILLDLACQRFQFVKAELTRVQPLAIQN